MRVGRSAGLAVAAVLVGGFAVADGVGYGAAAPARPSSDRSVGVHGSTPAERAALVKARETGRRIEVTAKRTESMEVYAEPSGHYAAELHAGPVRVRRGDGWVPVDTTLRRQGDGSVAPGATTASLRFSGGGAGPLVRLGRAGAEVALSWPGALPDPVLSGATVTYPEVLPGVDLKLTAGVLGFHELLVVKNRQAARDPRLAVVNFGLRTTGLTSRVRPDGGSDLVDAAGKVAFSSPRPTMWDSASHYAVGRFDVAAGRIGLVTDAALLTGPDTVYPVTIDPDYGVPDAGWAKVFSGHPYDSYWYGGGDVENDGRNLAKAGDCAWGSECDGIGLARSYFQFNISALHGAVVVGQAGVTTGAEFNVHEVYAPACSGAGHNYGLDLHAAPPFGPGLTWNNEVAYPDIVDGTRWEMHGYSGACPPAGIGWGVGPQVRAANDAGQTYVAFMIQGNKDVEQPDPYTWKKFDGYGLLVHYDWPPNQAANLTESTGTQAVACSRDVNKPNFVNNAANDITLSATGTDPDPGQPLWMGFEWWNRGGGKVGSAGAGPFGSGARFQGVIPKGSLAHDQKVSWHAWAGDGIVTGPDSGDWCVLDIDNVKPDKPGVDPPPVVGSVGAPVSLTLRAANSDVAGFRYGLTQGGSCSTPDRVTAATLGGTATVQVTPMKATKWDVWATAVDRAGNVSDCQHLTIEVRPGQPAAASWPLDGWWSGTDIPDAAGKHGATRPAAVTWTRGRFGDGLHFTGGTDSFVAPTGGQAVHTNQSFSAAAWVRLDRADSGSYAAVSQDGGNVAGFVLGYDGAEKQFTFTVAPQDSDAAPVVRANGGTPQAGRWTHLAGVYDAPAAEVRLYVDGVLSSTVPVSTAVFDATGGVQFGRAKAAGGYGRYWPGSLDDVRMYDRVLSDLPGLEAGEPSTGAPRSELDRLAAPATEEAYYPFDEGSGTTAGEVSGNYRTGTLTGGPAWTADRFGGSALRFDGVDDAVTTTQQPVRGDSAFTATALARLDTSLPGWKADAWHAVATQQGGTSWAWSLRYRGDTRAWSFAVTGPSGEVSADAPAAAVTDAWTHLAGVYEPGTGEVRLYVDGVLVARTPAGRAGPLTGNLVIGRARTNNVPDRYFAGEIDDVHVYTGVLSDPDINAASGRTEPRPPSLFAGSFSRYLSDDGQHFVGTGPAPPGFHLEWSLGMAAPAGAAGTVAVYSCRYNGGYFLDRAADCAGSEVLGQAGTLYLDPPAGEPTAALYRCLVLASGDHFVSVDPACESTPDKIRNEMLLGYARRLAPLVRYVGPGGLRWTTTHGQLIPPGYTPELGLAYVSLGGVTGTQKLTMCGNRAVPGDEFLSTDAGCEGQTNLGGYAGWSWPSPPDWAAESAQLYSCRASGGERFESLDPLCDGGDIVGPLGYVITRL
ncbi:MAG: LamG-like jellyroll fold domain-containing protein [Mycobacteriales bacterium]